MIPYAAYASQKAMTLHPEPEAFWGPLAAHLDVEILPGAFVKETRKRLPLNRTQAVGGEP